MTSVRFPGVSYVEHLGRGVPLLTYDDGDQFMIGAHVASLLKKETFNLYRSLRCRGATTYKADEVLLHFLTVNRIVRKGTRSVTLVPYEHVISLIEGEENRNKQVKFIVWRTGSIDEETVSDHEVPVDAKACAILANMVNS